MTIAKRIVILISLVVLLVPFGLGILAVTVATGVVKRDAEASMLSQAEIAAVLVSEAIPSRLNTLQELANQRDVRSIDHDIEGRNMVIGFSPVPGFDMTLVAMVEERMILHELAAMRNLMLFSVCP
jgi:hypothetical protein